MVSDAEFRAATRRGRELVKNVPHAVAVRYEARLNRIMITLSNKLEVALDPKLSQALCEAKPSQLKKIEIDGAGFALFFPKLDDGIYLPSLLRGIFGAKKWLDKQAAKELKEFEAREKKLAQSREEAVAA